MSQKLPIGIQSFEKLRAEGYAYIDKTALLYDLVKKGGYYFISRPRRFGKSLLVSTAHAYFEGRKELFQGLAIEQMEKEWQSYPVLHIDLNVGEYALREVLSEKLTHILSDFERQYGLTSELSGIAGRFENLIKGVAQSTGKQVVILIDEYEKPLLECIEQPDLQEQYRVILQSFYTALKSCDPYIHFVLLTGVSRFGKLSIFSGLNKLEDISMSDEFATICGITGKELSLYFSEEIESLAQKNGMTIDEALAEIKLRYDGYRFSRNAQCVYNPFSLLNNFSDKDFRNYWFATGTPTYLIHLLRRDDYELGKLAGDVISSEDRLGNIGMAGSVNSIAALYQSGYLTLKDYDASSRMYRLGFPNKEVEEGFLNALLPCYSGISDAKIDSVMYDLRRSIDKGQVDEFMRQLKSLLAGIPYESDKNVELNYRNLLFLVFTLLGCKPQAERPVSSGRIDMVLERSEYVYVFEFKLDKNAEMALDQMENKHYTDAYATDKRQVVKIGVNFSEKLKNIEEWKIVTL